MTNKSSLFKKVLFPGIFAVKLSLLICYGQGSSSGQKFVTDNHGAIIRGDVNNKKIALVFTGHEFADGGEIIPNVLKAHNIQGAFFLTGDFYRNPAFKSLISKLKQEGHYLGAHSDKHLLYADWTKRDSLLVTKGEFRKDLKKNYRRMAAHQIKKSDAPYFLPPFEWYNKSIADWTKEMNLQLINFTPGTRSTADYTYPEMGDRYVSSERIFESILEHDKKDPHALNGFILLIHIGTDPRRTDKFYSQLDNLIQELKSRGYRFVRINKLLDEQ